MHKHWMCDLISQISNCDGDFPGFIAFLREPRKALKHPFSIIQFHIIVLIKFWPFLISALVLSFSLEVTCCGISMRLFCYIFFDVGFVFFFFNFNTLFHCYPLVLISDMKLLDTTLLVLLLAMAMMIMAIVMMRIMIHRFVSSFRG